MRSKKFSSVMVGHVHHFVHRRAGRETPRVLACFLIPFVIGHFAAVRPEPENVLDARALDAASLEEIAAAKDGMVLAQRDEFSDEGNELSFAFELLPVHPTDFIVLAVGVVVAVLRAADFVAGKEHRDALRRRAGLQESFASGAHEER